MKITDSKHRIIELLNITGDSQNDFSVKTKIPKSTVSRYVNGEREPKQDKLSMIADAYHVSPAWLMGFDVPMEQEVRIDIETEPRESQILLEKYKNAIPEVRKAVDALLDIHEQDS